MEDQDLDAGLETSHDIHFLSRLERVALEQTELALRLYRSPDLVRRVLSDHVLPEGAQRIAIALKPGPEAPHVVVSRSGAFVTCLGEGMAASNLPLVPFERLEIHFNRQERLDMQRESIESFIGGRKDTVQKLVRIFTMGNQFSREEFLELTAVEPFLRTFWQRQIFEQLSTLLAMAPSVRRVRRIGRRESSAIKGFWFVLHALQHLVVLTSLGGRKSFQRWQDALGTHCLFNSLYGPLLQMGSRPVSARVIYALSRAGKPALAKLKRAIVEPLNYLDWLGMGLAIVAIGFRHIRLRSEVTRFILAHTVPSVINVGAAPNSLEGMKVLVKQYEKFAHFSPEKLRESWKSWAKLALDSMGRVTPQMAQEELDFWAVNLLSNDGAVVWADGGALKPLFYIIPLCATMPPEAWYFPRKHLHRFTRSYDPKAAVATADFIYSPEPVQSDGKAGRNAPCPCGSGKKYKKCCGS